MNGNNGADDGFGGVNIVTPKSVQTSVNSVPVASTATGVADQTRTIAEVQAAMMIARMNPRDPVQAIERVKNACMRPGLAAAAIYNYARGGTDISGPSIRLAEAIAQAWGNVQFGIREIEQRNGESTVQAYCWDVETNTRREVTFQVPHFRWTKKDGKKPLVDPRDIYEMAANQGARRLRACILGIIPGDVTEMAVSQCEETLKATADVSPKAVLRLVEAFEPFGVTKAMIEKRIQRKIEAIQPAQVVSLIKIGTSLRDGMSVAQDWFDFDASEAATTPKSNTPEQATQTPASTEATTAAPAEPPAATPAANGAELSAELGDMLEEISTILNELAGTDAAKRKAFMTNWSGAKVATVTSLKMFPDIIPTVLERAQITKREATEAKRQADEKKQNGKFDL